MGGALIGRVRNMSKSFCDEIGLDKFIWTEYMSIFIVHVSLKATFFLNGWLHS